MVVGLDEKKTQRAGLAFDVNSSLIHIEVTGESPLALQLAVRRICRLARLSDTILLLENICALLLPATPFSGAQALAHRLALLLADIPHALQVYHGTTALLVLQHLHEAGARSISSQDCAEIPLSVTQVKLQIEPEEEKKSTHPGVLPYLAFLAHYPPPGLLHLVPYELACRYQCVPLGIERNVLTLATCRWLNREIVTQLRAATRRGIFQVRCESSIIDEVLHYWRRLQKDAERDEIELELDEACSSPR
jgi:Type II secretion system (T2SS), protein E, N-terminal domain